MASPAMMKHSANCAIENLCWVPSSRAIQELRSLGVFLSTFVNAPVDLDGRMRCSFNIGELKPTDSPPAQMHSALDSISKTSRRVVIWG